VRVALVNRTPVRH